MTNENKLAAMDAVGELPDFGNLLLREGGYPHLPSSQSDVWHDAGTKPGKPGTYETEGEAWYRGFQYWNGEFWCIAVADLEDAEQFKNQKEGFDTQFWREVQS